MKGKDYKYLIIGGILTLVSILSREFSSVETNIELRILAIFIFFLAVLIWLLALIHFKKFSNSKSENYFDTDKIIQKGIFSTIRHPQYLSYILLNFGFLIISFHWFVIFTTFTAIFCFHKHTIQEEINLLERFGSEYQEYKQTVPRYNILKGIYLKLVKR